MTRDMRELDLSQLRRIVSDEPRALVFSTVSGAHLYGFPSRDSDVDLRGVHVTALEDVVGLKVAPETTMRDWVDEGAEIDLVTHDVAKFFRLLLRPNGYVLEQLMSPLVVTTSDVHQELIALAPRIVTKNHAHHYLGFARTQWKLFEKSQQLKPLLYTMRVLLTGIHLMRTGEVEANLATLYDAVGGPAYIPALIAAKAVGEHDSLDEATVTREHVETDVATLTAALESAHLESPLPDQPAAFDDLHRILIGLRTQA